MSQKKDQIPQHGLSKQSSNLTYQSSEVCAGGETTTSHTSSLGGEVTSTTCILMKAVELASSAFDAGACLMKRWLQKDDQKKKETSIRTAATDVSDFAAVTATLNFSAIPEYVSSVRRSQISSQQIEAIPWAFECTVESPPLNGSYNILFPILFGDTSKWLLKVPSDVQSWDDAAANNLRSEALTMKHLKGKGLPVPEVYAFDTSKDNSLKCPFILMEFLEGRPSYEGESLLIHIKPCVLVHVDITSRTRLLNLEPTISYPCITC